MQKKKKFTELKTNQWKNIQTEESKEKREKQQK